MGRGDEAARVLVRLADVDEDAVERGLGDEVVDLKGANERTRVSFSERSWLC